MNRKLWSASLFSSVMILSSSASLFSSVMILSSSPTLASQTINSISLSFCLNSGNGYWSKSNQEIDIGTNKLNSVLYMAPAKYSNTVAPAGIRCKLSSSNSSSNLVLYFGMKNNMKSITNKVSISLDGNLAASETVSSGSISSLTVDISQASHILIEADCISTLESCGEPVYFFESLSN